MMWCEMILTQDVNLIESCCIYIIAQQNIVVRKDVKFSEDVKAPISHDSPLLIEKNKEVIVPNTNLKVRFRWLHSKVDEVRLGSKCPYHLPHHARDQDGSPKH